MRASHTPSLLCQFPDDLPIYILTKKKKTTMAEDSPVWDLFSRRRAQAWTCACWKGSGCTSCRAPQSHQWSSAATQRLMIKLTQGICTAPIFHTRYEPTALNNNAKKATLTHTPTHPHICTHTHTHIYTHTHTHTHIHACVHTHTHTHIHKLTGRGGGGEGWLIWMHKNKH